MLAVAVAFHAVWLFSAQDLLLNFKPFCSTYNDSTTKILLSSLLDVKMWYLFETVKYFSLMVIVARYFNPILGQICGLLVNRKWGINPTFLQGPLRFRLFFQDWEKFGESLVRFLETVPALQLSAIFILSLHKISDTKDSTCLSHDQLRPAIETESGIVLIGSFWKMGPWDDRLKQTRYRNTFY